MAVNNLLDKLEKILTGAWRIPMTKGKCAVDPQEILDIIDDIRIALPKEIKDAKIIVENRHKIITDAKQIAVNIETKAKIKKDYIVSQEYIVKEAKKTASEIVNNAVQKSNNMKQNTNEYIENIIDSLEKALQETLRDFRTTAKKTKQVIKKSKVKF